MDQHTSPPPFPFALALVPRRTRWLPHFNQHLIQDNLRSSQGVCMEKKQQRRPRKRTYRTIRTKKKKSNTPTRVGKKHACTYQRTPYVIKTVYSQQNSSPAETSACNTLQQNNDISRRFISHVTGDNHSFIKTPTIPPVIVTDSPLRIGGHANTTRLRPNLSGRSQHPWWDPSCNSPGFPISPSECWLAHHHCPS